MSSSISRGWPEISRDTAVFPLEGRGLRFNSAELPPTGPCGWLPGTGALVRTQLLRDVPIDPAMTAYYEDNDWSLRVTRRDPGAFRRCREAIVLHLGGDATPSGERLEQRWRTAGRLTAHAHFLRRHGKIFANELQDLVPELCNRGGGLDLPAARLLLALVEARGPRWLVAQWQGDGLAPLLRGARLKGFEDEFERLKAEVHHLAPLEDEVTRLQDEVHQLAPKAETLAAIEAGGWWRLRGRLAPLLRPASRAREWLAR